MRCCRDDPLNTNTQYDDAEAEREVSITPDVESDGVSMRAHVLFMPGGAIEVPPADQERHRHTEDRRDRGLRRPVLLALHSLHDRNHRLAQQDQREQTEALRHMRRIRWSLHVVRHREPRCSEVNRER